MTDQWGEKNESVKKNNMDWVLHIAILILITISIIFIYSAQFQSINEIGSIWFKQLIYAGLGIIIYFLTAGSEL